MKKILAVFISLGVLSALIVAAAAVVLPGATAYAAPLAQGGVRLENLLKREQIVLADQQQRLGLSNQVAAAAQTWISNLQGRGKDVSALQSALAAFQSGLAQAQGSFNTAQNALNTHAGFDASGKVTNAAEALNTLSQAGRAERQFHLTITQATIDFRQAVRQYLQANQ